MASASKIIIAPVVVVAILAVLQVSHADKSGGGGTPAVMTENGFQRGQSGDGRFHSNGEKIAALSTRWYEHGRRCHKKIRVTAHNGRSVEATVVDECDSQRGCKDTIVDTSSAVWKALGLDSNVGVVPVTWSDA
jgi:hypothetical protein